ncbi:MAG TPA: alkaline phosphatase family protein [Candidatus Polarisedimenticolia bacterium]|nr:alkaline phosphatase family protein [Candidatus Polarisedimenticolia bacterium]
MATPPAMPRPSGVSGRPASRAFLRWTLALLLPCLLAAAPTKPASPKPDAAPERRSLPPLAALGRPTGVKIVLVGIDGATFKVLDPLLRDGSLPSLQKLIARGARGVLKSLPQPLSPAVWTTVVTGQEPAVHGIRDFLVLHPGAPDGKTATLVSSNDRRSLALWNLAGAFGDTVGFAGWWATWPAEPVRGWIVSDRMARSRFSEWHDGTPTSLLTFPRKLASELALLRVDPSRPPLEEIRDLAAFSPGEMAEFLAVKKPIFAHGLSVLKFSYCEQRTYEEMSLRMLSREVPDLTGIYLVANDPVSHTFWHDYEPQSFSGVPPEEVKRLGRLIPSLSMHNDRFLARLLKTLPRDTVVIVVSDHGFQASGRLPQPRPPDDFPGSFEQAHAQALEKGTISIGQPGEHDHEGIFIAAGGPIRRGVSVDADVLDITPTILALLGMPVAEDMKGRVLKEILQPDFLERYPVKTIASYEEHLKHELISPTDGDDPEKLDLLRSLGYIK